MRILYLRVKYVFRMEKNVSRVMGQNSLTPQQKQQVEVSTRPW